MQLQEAVKGYLMDSQIEQQAQAYLQNKRVRLDRFVRWCAVQGITDLDEVTANLARAYVLHLQSSSDRRYVAEVKPVRPATVAAEFKTIRAFFAWCRKEGLLEQHEDPTARVPRIKVPRHIIPTFTGEQLAALIESCDPTTSRGVRDCTILLVLMDTGIRVGELCRLALDGVHDDYLVVFGKGRKEREVGLGPTASKMLWKYIHQHRKPRAEHERRVFLSRSGRPLLPMAVWTIVQQAGERAGIEGTRTSPHTFRHTFAKTWLANGGDVLRLSRVLGHTDVQTTEIYLQDFNSREARSDHAQFSPVEQFRLGKHVGRARRRS